MPSSLKKIHEENDDLVNEIFFRKYSSEEDIMKLLFSMYEDLTNKENKRLF